MRLVLDLAPDWAPRRGTRSITVAPDVLLEIGALVPAPGDRRRWWPGTPGTSTIVESTTDTLTSLGWPCSLLALRREREGRLVEVRLAACYTFLEYVAVATVIAPRQELLDAERARVEETLASGRPDWRGSRAIRIADLLTQRGAA